MASMPQFHDSAHTFANATRARDGRSRRAGPADELVAMRIRASTEYDDSLSTLIESEIIPRLMMAHRGATPPVIATLADGACCIGPDDVAIMVPLALNVEADVLLAHIESFLAKGIDVETVMIDLLAPTARLLGEYWETDRCDFVDVTMGLWRLQEVVHEISASASYERRAAVGRRALFASMPGDQHNFGTLLVDELFQRDGWSTERLSDASTPTILNRVATEWFDMIGLTISRDCHIGSLPSMIVGLRSVSRNPRLSVMVGGRVFVVNPELASEVGADGTASDAKLALIVAHELLSTCD